MKTDLMDHLPLLYVIGCGQDGPMKIGVTAQIAERMKCIQVSSPYPVKIYGVRFASARPESGRWNVHAMFRRGAQRLEKAVHAKLKEFDLKLNGEWFEIGAADALAVIDKVGRTTGPLAAGMTDLLSVDLSGRADASMAKMHRMLSHEALALNMFIAKHNGC